MLDRKNARERGAPEERDQPRGGIVSVGGIGEGEVEGVGP
jgi:hypothetical protein